jgi:type IV secretory pathway VirB2 component (pilin)
MDILKRFCNFVRSSRHVVILSVLLLFFFSGSALADGTAQTPQDDAVLRVMCNIINFTKKLGMPIITGVILGSSIMAIFGKFGWGAIVMLVVFTAVFFGSEQIIGVFVKGLSVSGGADFKCEQYK